MRDKRSKVSLGWSLAAVLALGYSIRAGALDFDRELKRQGQISNEISGTLGRDHGMKKRSKAVRELPSLEESDLVEDYKVELIPVKRDKSS